MAEVEEDLQEPGQLVVVRDHRRPRLLRSNRRSGGRS
jgi:hypothetical protein